MPKPKAGDIVAYVKRRKVIPAKIVRWSGRPDSHALLVDINLERSSRYVDGLIVEDHHNVQGENLLPPGLVREAREKIEPFLLTKRGQALISNARALPMLNPSDGRGAPSWHDIPLIPMAAHSSSPTEQLLSYIGQGAAQRAFYERFQQASPRYYRIFILNIHEGRKPAEIARLLNISAGHARVLKRRALTVARRIATQKGVTL